MQIPWHLEKAMQYYPAELVGTLGTVGASYVGGERA